MTWTWGVIDRTTIGVLSPDSERSTLDWSDYDGNYPNANGWTWSGECPDPVYNFVVENDVAAALKEDLEQDDSAFGDT